MHGMRISRARVCDSLARGMMRTVMRAAIGGRWSTLSRARVAREATTTTTTTTATDDQDGKDDKDEDEDEVAATATATATALDGDGATRLTHVDDVTGAASMVNVGAKPSTSRTATASARVTLGREAYEAVKRNALKKGDVLATARLAGITGAKKTHDLIPLCHQISLDAVKIDLRMVDADAAVEVSATATCAGKTGVEMEALTAAAVSGLTIYDMCKAVSKDIVIERVRLESKIGGKSGEWRRSTRPRM